MAMKISRARLCHGPLSRESRDEVERDWGISFPPSRVNGIPWRVNMPGGAQSAKPHAPGRYGVSHRLAVRCRIRRTAAEGVDRAASDL